MKDLTLKGSEKRLLYGQVLSDKMDKTITVLVENKVPHPLYKKYIKRSTKFHVHDGDNIAKKGNKVSFFETRPYSKTKSWCIAEVIDS